MFSNQILSSIIVRLKRGKGQQLQWREDRKIDPEGRVFEVYLFKSVKETELMMHDNSLTMVTQNYYSYV